MVYLEQEVTVCMIEIKQVLQTLMTGMIVGKRVSKRVDMIVGQSVEKEGMMRALAEKGITRVLAMEGMMVLVGL